MLSYGAAVSARCKVSQSSAMLGGVVAPLVCHEDGPSVCPHAYRGLAEGGSGRARWL